MQAIPRTSLVDADGYGRFFTIPYSLQKQSRIAASSSFFHARGGFQSLQATQLQIVLFQKKETFGPSRFRKSSLTLRSAKLIALFLA